MRRWATSLAAAAGVVGAGFASGREAAVFFVPYGGWGLAGLVLAILLVGRAASRPPRPSPAPLRVVWLLLLWVTLAATLAAGGEVLHHLAGWPVPAGAAGLAAAAAAVPRRAGTRRLQGVTVLLLSGAILLIGGVAGVRPGCASVEAVGWLAEWAVLAPGGTSGRGTGGLLPSPVGALLAALLYASYTSALLAGGIGAGGRRRDAWPAATLVGVLLAVMAGALFRAPAAGGAALPMLVVAAHWGAGTAQAYAWLLGLAAANAAVATTRALGDSLATLPGGPAAARWAVALLAWAASSLGFANLVGTVYPLLGWAWLPVLFGAGRACPPREQSI